MESVTPEETVYLTVLDAESVAYNKLLPILVQCFSVIFLGYIAGRLGIVTEGEAKGLGLFIRYFSLPSLIFNSLAKIEFNNVNWMFLACVFLAKLLVFLIVMILTLVLTKPTNMGKAGLYAIFATQSNDFVFGYPLLLSLYSKTNPWYSDLLYLIAPIQLVTLNPIGYALMEKQRQKDEQNVISKLGLCLSLISNPIVIMTILGIIGNVIFRRHLPPILSQILQILGAAFPASALFFLGHNITGKFSLLKGNKFIIPALLITAKILVLPIILFELVHHLVSNSISEDVKDLGSFAFLYGTFPTAPSVFIFANQFGMPTDVVAPGMVACTLLSAPLMFVTASMTTLSTSNLFQFRTDLLHVLFCISIIGSLCSLWVIVIFLFSRKWRFVIHKITFCLFCSQLFTSLGGILWTVIDVEYQWAYYIQYTLSVGGIFSARIWTSLLAVSLALLQWRSLCFVIRISKYIMYIGFSSAALVVLVLAIRVGSLIPNKNNTDPNFPFGESQLLTAFIVILLTLLVTLFSLVCQYYHSKADKQCSGNETAGQHSNSETGTTEDITLDSANRASHRTMKNSDYSVFCSCHFNCSEKQKEKCNEAFKIMKFDSNLTQSEVITSDILRCLILLLLLCMSMIVGLTVCLWKLFLEETTGIYVELEFLDVILNYGQGIFSFFVFGLDNELVMAFCTWSFSLLCGYGTKSPQAHKVSPATQLICKEFSTYHKDKCIAELCSDHFVGNHFYEFTFRGTELVEWLIDIGLANTRKEAQQYGQHLLLGGVISHIKNRSAFSDNLSLYKFC